MDTIECVIYYIVVTIRPQPNICGLSLDRIYGSLEPDKSIFNSILLMLHQWVNTQKQANTDHLMVVF